MKPLHCRQFLGFLLSADIVGDLLPYTASPSEEEIAKMSTFRAKVMEYTCHQPCFASVAILPLDLIPGLLLINLNASSRLFIS
jgi:hypothetical protein